MFSFWWKNVFLCLIYFIFSNHCEIIENSLIKSKFLRNCTRKEYFLREFSDIYLKNFSQALLDRKKFIDFKLFDLKFDVKKRKLIENNDNFMNYSPCYFMKNETLTKINQKLIKNGEKKIILQENSNNTNIFKIFDVDFPEIEIKLLENKEFSLNNESFMNFSFFIETNKTENFNKLEIIIKNANNIDKIVKISLEKRQKNTYFINNIKGKTNEILEMLFLFDDFFILTKNFFSNINDQTRKTNRLLQTNPSYYTISPIDLNFTTNANCNFRVDYNLFIFIFLKNFV